MFDWNDEELSDIIWGEAHESGDHIVPYPKESEEKTLVTFGDRIKKRWNQEAGTVKPAEQKTPGAKNDSSGCKLECSSQIDPNEGFSAPGFDMDSWPDLPLPIAAYSNGYAGRNGQDSISEMTNFNAAGADGARLDSDPELFGDDNEDKGQRSFLDYGWANIGSFDDLDRIFRNDDPIFGHENLGNADELWSSTDVVTIPVKSFPLSVGSPSSGSGALGNTSEKYEIKMEFVSHENQFLTPGYGRINGHDSHALQNMHPSKDEVSGKQCCSSINSAGEFNGEKSKSLLKDKLAPEMIGKLEASNTHPTSENSATKKDFADKGTRQRKLLKSRIKVEENSDGKFSQNLCGAWSPTENQIQQFGNQFATSALQTFPSPSLSPRRQLGGPDSLRYLHTSHPYLLAEYGNPAHQFPIVPPLQHAHSERDKYQPVFAGFEFSPGSSKHGNSLKKSADVPTNSLTMTPQEKIEKLRRRQQMQAMHAIQKQQQQFTHQVTCHDHSISQKCAQEGHSEDTVATNIEVEENLKLPPTLEPSSPVEQDDSNTISMVIDECSQEETILDQLQDVIGKLDNKIRLCVRDSLFRLAQSAMQRHSVGDTSSTNKSSKDENEVAAKEDSNSHNRSTGVPDAETETNPIDRTVAHLLFHRPPEPSVKPVQDGEIRKSPVSNKLLCEPKTEGLVNQSMGCLSESSTEKQCIFHKGSKEPCLLVEPQHEDHFRSSPYINTPENSSNSEPEDGGVMEVEASQ